MGTTPSGIIYPDDSSPIGPIQDTLQQLAETADAALSAPRMAYAPALTGMTIGDGSVSGRYQRVGVEIRWSATIIFGATTSVTGLITVGLPANTRTLRPRSPLGRAVLHDVSTAAIRLWDATNGDAVDRAYLCDINGSPASNLSPWGWANGDSIEINGAYEAA